MTLSVIAPAFDPNTSYALRDAALLTFSAHRVGINPIYFGLGKPWSSWRERLKEALAVLPSIETTHVLMTDAFDALFICGESEIIDAYNRAGAPPLLLSAERDCWPDTSIAGDFPQFEVPWRYPNGGGWMGERQYLIDYIPQVLECGDSENDQELWARAFLLGMLPGAKLDHWCRVFQTVSGSARDLHWVQSQGRMLNDRTGTYPCVVHWNGRCFGREEVWNNLTGSSVSPATTST